MSIVNFPTAAILAVLAVLVCLSVRVLIKKGTCGYKDQCKGGCSESCAGGCASCTATDSMLDDIRKRLARSR